ncbi:MAG: hypothetical protein B6D57_02595 [Candidatus Coatesbacteria bacterium 4484_99]|uniref:DUF1009 domain-containing protein n=1 Tax=Candidatus Coatesbacteria bacterium 4484_99 TaxID=1970774 RepID=A0A1W9S155_9BACT|nr:MAG: hypothetical protein B6D57_02595 [Candidatus Coatesbacteria bacterium 4484_99]
MSNVMAILAGDGDIPSLAIKTAIKKNYNILVIALTKDSYNNLKLITKNCYHIEPVKSGRIIKAIKDFGAGEVVLVGSVNRGILYRGTKPDITTIRAITKLRGFDDKNIVNAIEDILSKSGITLLSQRELLNEYMAPSGSIAGKKPPSSIMKQVKKFMPIAKSFARMGAGQVMVIKNNTIVAIEGMEGTNETIQRAGALVGEGIIVIKATSEDHDYRLDMPTVGIETLKAVEGVGGGYIVIEAGRILILDIDKFKKTAKELKISVYGY